MLWVKLLLGGIAQGPLPSTPRAVGEVATGRDGVGVRPASSELVVGRDTTGRDSVGLDAPRGGSPTGSLGVATG